MGKECGVQERKYRCQDRQRGREGDPDVAAERMDRHVGKDLSGLGMAVFRPGVD